MSNTSNNIDNSHEDSNFPVHNNMTAPRPRGGKFHGLSLEPAGHEAPTFRAVSMCIDPSTILLETPRSNIKSPFTPHVEGRKQSSSSSLLQQKNSNSVSFLVGEPQHDQSARTSTGWDTDNNPAVPKMNMFYPIALTHRRFPKTELKTIMEKLTRLFCNLSLDTVFDNSPAALAATCVSMGGVELKVQFFECQEDSSHIVVEISRVAGDTIEYCGLARKIMAACNTERDGDDGNDEDDGCDEEDSKPAMNHRGRVDSILRHLPVPEPDSDTIQESLELALGMMLTDRYDARYLGLQSLVILTDPNKTYRPVAIAVAQAILLGKIRSLNGTTISDSRIQERIFSLALCGRWPDTPLDRDDGFVQDKPHAYLALMIVANAANLLSDKADFTTFLEGAAQMTAGTSLILTMQERVWNARMEPHTAYLATRILAAVCRGQPEAMQSCSIQTDAVRAAQHVGQTSHAALEIESGELLVALHALAA